MLESMLGFEVASRSGRGIALTPRGKRYAQDVRKSLLLLADAHEEGAGKALAGTLRISSTPGFASMWLCNHIASFQSEHPNLCLEIVTSPELGEATDRDVSISIDRLRRRQLAGAHRSASLRRRIPTHVQPRFAEHARRPRAAERRAALSVATSAAGRMAAMADDERRRISCSTGITFSDLMLVQSAAIAGQGTRSRPASWSRHSRPRSALRGGYYLLRSAADRHVGVHPLAQRPVHAHRHGTCRARRVGPA